MGDSHPLARDEEVRSVAVFSGFTTADGNVGGTTLIDSKLIGVNDFVANKAVLIMSGPCRWEMQRCSTFSNVAGTITVASAFSAQITADVVYRLLNFGAGVDLATVSAILSRQASFLDFWSPSQEAAVIPAVAADVALPSVVVGGLPAGCTILRAVAMFKFRAVENTNAAGNKLSGAQDIQVNDAAATGWVDAINFLDDMFGIAASTREGGDVFIGDEDIKARVDGDDTYSFQWDEALADGASIEFNDVQCGLRIWYR